MKSIYPTLRIVDQYNPLKVWLIRKSNCGHYYLNQEVSGRVINKAFGRTTLNHIKSVCNY